MEKHPILKKEDYIKWYNLAKNEISNEELIPNRTDEEIIKLVSANDWIMFSSKGETKEERKNSPNPNVYLAISAYKNGIYGEGTIGVNFNNIGACDKFEYIMKGTNEEIKIKLNKALRELKNNWEISVSRKIKDKNWAQRPKYTIEFEEDIKNLNEKIVDNVVDKINKIRKEGKLKREIMKTKGNNGYYETPSVSLIVSSFELTEDNFLDRIYEAFKILSICLKVKGGVEINKENRALEKEFKILEDKIPELEKELIGHEKMIESKISGFTKEGLEKKKKELKEKKDRIIEIKKKLKID